MTEPAPCLVEEQPGVSVEVITEGQQLQWLEVAWRDLLPASALDNVFSTVEWLSSWWHVFGSAQRLLAVVARRGRRVVGLAPFVVSPREGFQKADLMGGHVSDYKDFLVDGREDRSAVLERLLRQVFASEGVDLLQVSGLREDSPNFRPLQSVLPRLRTYRAACFPSGHAPYIQTGGTWQDYWCGLDGQFRKKTRRQREKLEAAYPLIEITSPFSEEEVRSDLETFFRLKMEHWKSKGAHAVVNDPAVQRFYHLAFQRMRSAGWLRVVALRVCGEVAAVDVGLEYGGKYYSCQSAFNERFEAYSPGRLLDIYITRDAFERGLREVDLLLGAEAYKSHYHPVVRRLHTLFMAQDGPRGRMAEAWFRRLRPRLEQTSQSCPAMKPLREWVRRAKFQRG